MTEDKEFEYAQRESDLQNIALEVRDALKPIIDGEIERGHCVAGTRECYGGRPGMRKTTLKDAQKIARHAVAFINRKINEFDAKYNPPLGGSTT